MICLLIFSVFLICSFWFFECSKIDEKDVEDLKKVQNVQRKYPSIFASYWQIIKHGLALLFQVKSDDRLEYLKHVHKYFPGTFSFNFWKFRTLFVYDPDIAQKIFNSNACLSRPFMEFVRLDSGILAAKYPLWKITRKHINLAFNLNVLKGYIPLFVEKTEKTVLEMKKYLGGKEFNLYVDIARLTSAAVAATTMNVENIEWNDEVIDATNKMMEAIFDRIITPVYHPESIFKWTSTYKKEMSNRDICYEFGDKLIQACRKQMKDSNNNIEMDENGNYKDAVGENGKPKINHLIDQMLSYKEKDYTDVEIREQIFTFLITGTETSANLVANAILLLAINPQFQDRVYEEINDVYCSLDVKVDYESLSDLKYMDRVLKETLRLATPIPIAVREAIDDCDLGNGQKIFNGTKIFFMLYILHRRKDIWGKNSDAFNPDNFLPEMISSRHPYSYVPFGSGPKNCIGFRYAWLSAKSMLVTLLRSYKFSTKMTMKDMKFKIAFTGKLILEHTMTIEKRN